MTKITFILLVPFFSISFILCMDTPAKINPDSLTGLVRYSSVKEFQEHFSSRIFDLFSEKDNTMMHDLAHSFTDAELRFYNEKYKTSFNVHDIARKHAMKVDLLLRNDQYKSLLNTPNKDGITPAILAAQNGYLPVVARFMLSNPANWRMMMAYLPVTCKEHLVSSFLKYIENPQIGIPYDLRITLTENQLSHLKTWAQQVNRAWPHLDQDQTKYLFECYLATDIEQQYRENPKHPLAQAVINKK